MTHTMVDAVLPLTINDLDRFRILQRSLAIFCQDLLGTIWVVVPDDQIAEISGAIESETYRVIAESTLVPESKWVKVKGWYLQQLIKLAIAEHIETDFYLTLDADIICVQTVRFSDLVKDGRAVYNAAKGNQLEDNSWCRAVKDILRTDPTFSPQNSYYNVTPAVLSRSAVIRLQQHLRGLSHTDMRSKLQWSSSKRNNFYLLVCWLFYRVLPKSSTLKTQLSDYRAYLIRNIPWTEYLLYYNFCDAEDLLEKYHLQSPHCIYAGEESVWQESQYEDWNPEKCFEGERKFFFCVFQSNTQLPAEVVWKNIERFLVQRPSLDYSNDRSQF
jgi:Family of unknown function (DUF6492)